MSPVELIALSLIASVVVAGVGRIAAGQLDRRTDDVEFRERVWTAALWSPLLPPLAVGLLLLTPAPQRAALIVTPAPIDRSVLAVGTGPFVPQADTPPITLDAADAAGLVLVLAGLASIFRVVLLARRSHRLMRLMATAVPASDDITGRVAIEARRMALRPPRVMQAATEGDVLLAGFVRPMLILPLDEIRDEALPLIVRHELAHLGRGDHRAIWLEEALMVALAFNPVLPGLRAGRAAVREEACDRVALDGASGAARRAYARRLIDILKTAQSQTAPALSFGGERKSPTQGETDMKTPTMRRMAAILTPPRPAGRGARAAALGAGVAVIAAAGLASAAVALQREGTASLILTEDRGPVASRDFLWTGAALSPVYKSIWPAACGYGTDNAGVMIHLGEGCTSAATPDARLTLLAGVDPTLDPRATFAAVKTACDAGRPVVLAWTENGAAKTAEAACIAPAVAPPEPKSVEIALTFEGVGAPQRGDRLEVLLERAVENGEHSKSMMFDLGAASILPNEVRGWAPQELFAEGQAPKMTARLVGGDGTVRAQSAAQPKPMLISRDRAIAFADLKPVGA